MKFLRIVLLWCLLPGAAMADGLGGWYLTAGQSFNRGEFSFDLSIHDQSVNILQFSLAGQTQSLCGGYRASLFTHWTVGSEVCGDYGRVSGSQGWTTAVDGRPATLRFSAVSEREYTARLHVGRQLSWADDWHAEFSYGISAAQYDLTTVVSYDTSSHSYTKSGWAVGRTAGVRLLHRLSDRAYVSLGYDQLTYEAAEPRSIFGTTISATVSEQTEIWSVMVGFRF